MSSIDCDGNGDMPTYEDMEFAVKTQRVLAVLDSTIHRTQLALCLPLLLRHNATLLRPLLPPRDLAVVLMASAKYVQGGGSALQLSDPQSSTMASYRASKDSYRGSLSQGRSQDLEGEGSVSGAERWSSAVGLMRGGSGSGRQDPDMSHAVHILWNNADVRDMVQNRLLPLVSSTGSVFLEYLTRLRVCTAERLSRSPAAERAREAELCAAWRGSRRVQEERARLQDQLRAQADQLGPGGHVADTARAVALLRHNVNVVRRQCQEEVKVIVNKSERAMVLEWRNSQYRQDNLHDQLKEAEEKFSSTLTSHLAEEKELRNKRYKVETLLLTWLQKFDTDVGEKFQEYQQLSDEFEAEALQMKELTEKLAEQEEEYREVLAEKLRYEKEEEDELVYSLASKHAARVIQRTWRAYRLRKRLAKTGKKKGKGKGKGKTKK